MQIKSKAALHTLLILTSAWLQLTYNDTLADDRDEIIKSAITLFNQRKPAIQELRKAAETGDMEAQFYLGEALRIQSQHMTTESAIWYEKSARQGDMYAMFRLARQQNDLCNLLENCPLDARSSQHWQRMMMQQVTERVEAGDAEAMEMMYTITGKLDWLIKSASNGHPSAQWWLAKKYVAGSGFFWPGQRSAEIEKLFKLSAEGGYPDAMNEYSAILLQKGDIEGAQKWTLNGVAIGHAVSIGNYAFNLERGKYHHFKINLQLAYTLNLVLAELDGGGGAGDIALYSLDNIKPQLSAEQINQATKDAEIWKATHPPISYYPPKLEY